MTQHRTPKNKPLEAKAKAHQRAAARAEKKTAEALRDRLNGSATIGRINSNTNKIRRMLAPGWAPEKDTISTEMQFQILQTLIRNDFGRLKYLLPTLRSVELTTDSGPQEIVIRIVDGD